MQVFASTQSCTLHTPRCRRPGSRSESFGGHVYIVPSVAESPPLRDSRLREFTESIRLYPPPLWTDSPPPPPALHRGGGSLAPKVHGAKGADEIFLWSQRSCTGKVRWGSSPGPSFGDRSSRALGGTVTFWGNIGVGAGGWHD